MIIVIKKQTKVIAKKKVKNIKKEHPEGAPKRQK